MKFRIFLVILLLSVAAYLRLNRIASHTEFLGDQGVLMNILYDLFHNHKIPLVGLQHSNGIHSGPFYLYLMALPYHFSGGDPVAVAAVMAIFGVLAVLVGWYVGSRLFGFWLGLYIALLYAISPAIVERQRLIWNPTLIPFFSLLGLLSIFKIWQEKKPRYFLLLGFATSAQLQMHVGTMATVGFFWLFACGAVIFRHIKRGFFWALAGIFVFLIFWSPYIVYQTQHEWIDVRNFVLFLFLPSAHPPSSQLQDSLNLFFSMFHKVLPIFFGQLLAISTFIIIGGAFIFGGFWARVLVIWLLFAFLPIFFYRGSIFEQYTYGLAKIPFFLLGFLLISIFKRFSKLFAVILSMIILLMNVGNIGSISPPVNDLTRIGSVAKEMIRQANGAGFSFTLLSSRSISDFHYRYIFRTLGVTPRFIYDEDYPYLFLVCEYNNCPSWNSLEVQQVVQVLCYEENCKVEYPDKRLKGWKLKSEITVRGARIYTLEKI